MSTRATFFGIEIGKTGIMISQKALDVTGHNIANVDTAGYTRQRLVTTSYEPYAGIQQFQPVQKGRVGGGVTVQILDQIRDKFLDRQFRSENTIYNNWSTRVQGLNYIEALLEGDSITDITTSLDKMLEAFNDLAAEPYDSAQRIVLQQRALQLIEDYGHTYDRLMEMQTDQDLCVETVTTRINNLSEQMASLNKHIYIAELDGQPANDLRDKRNLLLDELSGYMDITYYEDAKGKLTVELGNTTDGSNILVSHTTINTLECKKEQDANPLSDGDPLNVVYWATGPNAGDALNITAGTLKAHVDMMTSTNPDMPGIPYFVEKLNNMARALVQTVNEVHRRGYLHPEGTAVDENDNPINTGVDFFYVGKKTVLVDDGLGGGGTIPVEVDDLASVTAGNLRLSDNVKKDLNNIAASSEPVSFDTDWINPETGEPDPTKLKTGNNEIAKELYGIYNANNIKLSYYEGTGAASSLVEVSIGGLNGYLNGMVLDISVTLNYAKNKLSTQSSLLLATDTQRTSIAGVSLDEEMTNLIKYQHAYSGSSRVITAMDEALETLINKMGLVGRS